MRYSGPVSKTVAPGSEHHIPYARTLLGQLRETLRDAPFGIMRRRTLDGALVTVMWSHGNAYMYIDAVTDPDAEGRTPVPWFGLEYWRFESGLISEGKFGLGKVDAAWAGAPTDLPLGTIDWHSPDLGVTLTWYWSAADDLPLRYARGSGSEFVYWNGEITAEWTGPILGAAVYDGRLVIVDRATGGLYVAGFPATPTRLTTFSLVAGSEGLFDSGYPVLFNKNGDKAVQVKRPRNSDAGEYNQVTLGTSGSDIIISTSSSTVIPALAVSAGNYSHTARGWTEVCSEYGCSPPDDAKCTRVDYNYDPALSYSLTYTVAAASYIWAADFTYDDPATPIVMTLKQQAASRSKVVSNTGSGFLQYDLADCALSSRGWEEEFNEAWSNIESGADAWDWEINGTTFSDFSKLEVVDNSSLTMTYANDTTSSDRVATCTGTIDRTERINLMYILALDLRHPIFIWAEDIMEYVFSATPNYSGPNLHISLGGTQSGTCTFNLKKWEGGVTTTLHGPQVTNYSNGGVGTAYLFNETGVVIPTVTDYNSGPWDVEGPRYTPIQAADLSYRLTTRKDVGTDAPNTRFEYITNDDEIDGHCLVNYAGDIVAGQQIDTHDDASGPGEDGYSFDWLRDGETLAEFSVRAVLGLDAMAIGTPHQYLYTLGLYRNRGDRVT